MQRAKRVLITTIGSLGDLHPCLGLATELKRRGHSVTIATTPYYRQRIEALNIAFYPLRPDWDPTDPELIRQCQDVHKGLEVLYRKMILPQLGGTYDDLLAAAKAADLLLAGELVYAAPLVAEKLALRWGSLILSPFSFFSAHDPSVTVNAPALIRLRRLGAPAYRLGLSVARLATRHWSNPVRELRRSKGLRRKCDPVFRDKFSPDLVLALFSQFFAARQADWPRQTIQPGFVRFENHVDMPNELSEFLADGEPPIVFAQGSTAVHNPEHFYTVSVEAARRLRKRAVLIGAKDFPETNSADLVTLPYANYAQIFPHALVNVHQGGSGTTGEALRAGRPMLVVPYGWDQPDNAARAERLGVARHLPREKYSVDSAQRALRNLIEDPSFSRRASQIAAQLQAQNGLEEACNAIERLLAKTPIAANTLSERNCQR